MTFSFKIWLESQDDLNKALQIAQSYKQRLKCTTHGLCDLLASQLKMEFSKENIISKLSRGYIITSEGTAKEYIWNVIQDHYLDIAADQFGFPPIVFNTSSNFPMYVEVPSSKYNPNLKTLTDYVF